MKRNLVALAVAGAFLAPAAAWADGSGIVLTGVIHGGINVGQEEDEDGNDVYESQPNIGTFATRWEIDGTEDLGWSQVIFGLAVDQKFAGSCAGSNIICNTNNIGDLNNRNSYLGLSGGWGTLKIGQNEHVYEIQQILQDPDPAAENTFATIPFTTSYGVGLDDDGIGFGEPPGFTRRDPQSIWYTSPNFGGVTIDLAYITPGGRKTESGLGPTSDVSPQGAQIGLQWKSAFGLSLYAAYAQYDDESLGSIAGSNKNQAGRLGVGYGTELFQIDVSGQHLKFEDDDGLFLGTHNELERTNVMVSGSLNFGQHHIRAAFSQALEAELDGDKLEDSEARLFFIGYAYTLSKRTELQVNYGQVDNKDQAQFLVSSPGNDAKKFDIGIRHTF